MESEQEFYPIEALLDPGDDDEIYLCMECGARLEEDDDGSKRQLLCPNGCRNALG